MSAAALVAIALDEDDYIDEWLEYHRAIGFSHAYVYDNSDSNSLAKRLMSNEFVTVIHFPGKQRQTAAYEDFAKHGKTGYAWAAFIDIDEFIVLSRHSNIIDFLKDHCRRGSVSLNWHLFGSNGHERQSPEPVVRRFTKRSRDINHHVKSIVFMNDYVVCIGPHHFRTIAEQRDPRGRIFEGALNLEGTDDVAHINHYFTKSREEFGRKIERGRADAVAKRSWSDFDAHDLNDVEDTRILEKISSYY
jgi:hypothetical protein